MWSLSIQPNDNNNQLPVLYFLIFSDILFQKAADNFNYDYIKRLPLPQAQK